MTTTNDLDTIVSDLPKALCFGSVQGTTAFVSTGVTYPNGVAVVVRIDAEHGGTFVVSDDGYAQQTAEGMGAGAVLARVASGAASRAGLHFTQGTFWLGSVSREIIAAAVQVVANTSSRSVERVLSSLQQPRIRRDHELFDKRLQAAFGKTIVFDIEYRGATGHVWEFNAGVEQDGQIRRLFQLVFPSNTSIALANMKIRDILAVVEPPTVTAALSDYDGTDPTLRAVLSNAGGIVIPASAEIDQYRLSTVH